MCTNAEGDAKSPPAAFISRVRASWSRSASSLEKMHVSNFLASYHGIHEPAVLLWIRRRRLPFSLHIEKRRCMRAHWHACAFREEIDPHTLPTRRVSYLGVHSVAVASSRSPGVDSGPVSWSKVRVNLLAACNCYVYVTCYWTNRRHFRRLTTIP